MKTFNWFIKKKLLIKDETAKNLASAYLKKARNNITTMEILNKIMGFTDELGIPLDYDPNEWVVISAYYAMYLAALSVLAKLSYRSKNHTATSTALEELLVKKKLLDKEMLDTLEEIKVQKEEIEQLNRVRDDRETAQYSVTKQTTANIAREARQNAHEFTNKIEELIDMLEHKKA